MAGFKVQFGLEVEGFLVSLFEQFESDKALAADLIRRYNANAKEKGLTPMYRNIEMEYFGGKGYNEWQITEEGTLQSNVGVRNEFGLEFVSPITQYDSAWRKEVDELFRVILSRFKLNTNNTCGTHLHFSPKGRKWTLEEIKFISKTIIHFEGAFNILLPEFRRGVNWLKSNRFSNKNFRGMTEQECFEKIEECKNMFDIVNLMCPTRNYAWNYQNLYPSGFIGTLEFRQPPGITTSTECLAWMEFSLTFILAAQKIQSNSTIFGYSADIEGLKMFLHEGIIPGSSQPELFEPIFRGKTGSIPIATLQARGEAQMAISLSEPMP